MADNFLLQQYLNESVSRRPENVAVTDGTDSLSYGELSVLSNKIAHCLKSLGVGRQDRVVLCLHRSVHCLSVILGILKADAIYVPLDHKTPMERWVRIMKDAAPKALICDSKTLATVQEVMTRNGSTVPVLNVSRESEFQAEMPGLESIEACGSGDLSYLNNQDDIAYILYTSGSSGDPKGVMVSHANVMHYIDWAVSFFSITEKDKILGTAPFHFDMSTFDIYCTLKSAATLCVSSEIQALFPHELVRFVEQQQVTLWKGVSSLLMYMSRAGVLCRGSMPTLRQVLFAGEILPTRYLIDWMRAFPEKTFYNAYGPTESTGVSTCFRIRRIPEGPHVRIPIGSPRQGTKVFLLTEEHAEVSSGEVGEICIAGHGLARGYLNDPEKTAGVFIQNPLISSAERIYTTGDLGRLLPDGNLEYLGRKDRQLKFMGYRIEAGEVEQALLSIASVKDAVVDLLESKQNEGVLELVAFCETEGEIDVAMMSAELKRRLPGYMIPRHFFRIARMPRCDRGKIMLDALMEAV